MMRLIFILLGILAGTQAYGQGTLNIALQQQFSFVGCSSAANVCGTPLIGGLLSFFQVGTVATRQDSFQDSGLQFPNPWPLTLDANGRVPMFYLASGSVHVRLTDASGVVQFEYPSMLVIGPSGGGGGGGPAVDPTTVASTGDVKFRGTSEVLTGWVKLNGQTIGSATSGASGRANADTQALFIYLWGNYTDAHCPVITGRGASALADFTANKQLTVPDLRGRFPFGLDDMGAAAAGRLLASNVTSGGGDNQFTPSASGGEANHTLTATELANHSHGIVDVQHHHTIPANGNVLIGGVSPGAWGTAASAFNTGDSFTGITATQTTPGGATPTGGQAHNVMNPFMLGSFYIKL